MEEDRDFRLKFEVFEWYPRPELNRDLRFRKPLLYPFELRGQTILLAAA